MAVIAGVWCANEFMLPAPGVLAALIGLGVSLGPRGWPLAWVVLGTWAGLLAGTSTAPPFDPGRPVTMTVEVTGFPRTTELPGMTSITVRGRSRTVEQGGHLGTWRRDVFVGLPDRELSIPPGTRLRVRGFLRASVPPNNGGVRPAGAWRLRVESPRFVTVVRQAQPWQRGLSAGRQRIERGLARSSAQSSTLVRTLVLGQGNALEPHLLVGLRRAGLAHLTAVSGLHVGVWASVALLVLAPLGRRTRLLGAGSLVVVYAGLAGLPASAVRAAGMTLMLLLAHGIERPPTPVNALAVTVLVLALVDPFLVARFGFQLSVVATAGILGLGPAITARLSRLPGPLRLSLSATVAAQIATLPWVLPRFAMIAPLAPLVNLVLAPWLLLAMAATGLWSLAAIVAPDRAARALAWLDPLLAPLEALAIMPTGPLWTWIASPSTGLASMLACAITSWILRWRRATWCLAGVLVATVPHAAPEPVPLFAMLDVGQGDALLVRDGKHAILVDGGGWIGGDVAGRVVVPALATLGVRHLDAVVLTHPDLDHCAGLVSIARYLPVQRVWMAPGWSAEDPCIQGLRALPGVVEERLTTGMTRHVGRWRLEVLHPSVGESDLERNDRSLVLNATASDRHVLLTGDLQAAGERAVLQRPRDKLRATILKLGHHGSATSSGRPFLAAVQPRLALASAGRGNRFGHPASSVQARLEQLGIVLLRTDRGGAVHIHLPPDGPPRITRPPW